MPFLINKLSKPLRWLVPLLSLAKDNLLYLPGRLGKT